MTCNKHFFIIFNVQIKHIIFVKNNLVEELKCFVYLLLKYYTLGH